MTKIRTRFAPSPTGALHIGGVRTALYNYLFAKQNGGDFLLRIEDTDQKRYVESAEQYIIDSFKWFGIEFDESPSNPNPLIGKYRQSERNYTEYVDKLIKSGNAYYAFDTEEDLKKIRLDFESRKETFTYNQINRINLNNSLNLNAEELKKKLEEGVPYVIRFKMPINKELIVNDIIRGEVKFNTDTLDDKVLLKKDGTPTYHMANVVDDYLMEISHVIRGEEWLPSLPLHYMLYEALDFDKPEFAHLNLILNPNGKGKLSKRSAIKNGFSVFPLTAKLTVDNIEYCMEGYKELGFEKKAVLNFLALLGWTPKDNKEILTIKDMIECFDINSLSKPGARFDLDKLNWFNTQYVNKIPTEEVIGGRIGFDKEKEEIISKLAKERAVFRKDMDRILDLYYKDIISYTDKDKITKDCKKVFIDLVEHINEFNFSSPEQLKDVIYNIASNNNIKFGKIMPGLRQAILGGANGPDLMTSMFIFGKDKTIEKINNVL